MTAPIPHMERVNDKTHILRGAFFITKAPPAARNDATIKIMVNSSIIIHNFKHICY